MHRHPARLYLRLMLVATALAAAPALYAQSSCSSDGVARPVALVERFINADCESCWSDAKTPVAAKSEVAVDWVLPGSRGDDAPLSTVARREGLQRLESLKQSVPAQSSSVRGAIAKGTRTARVAHGLPFNGYLGASIEMKPAARGPWVAWLALVETIPAGIEGTPVERNLVRNLLQTDWGNARRTPARLAETRSMNIPEGASPERLRVIGWVEDARGRIVAAAQSRCETTP